MVSYALESEHAQPVRDMPIGRWRSPSSSWTEYGSPLKHAPRVIRISHMSTKSRTRLNSKHGTESKKNALYACMQTNRTTN